MPAASRRKSASRRRTRVMLAAELALVAWQRDKSIRQHLAGRDPVPGSVYHVLLGVFAAMPALVQRR